MLQRLASLFALSFLVVIQGCGETVEDPAALLQSGDHAGALKAFEKVLAGDGDAETKFRAARDMVACAAEVDGDDAASKAFQTLTTQFKDKLDVPVLFKIGNDLASAGCSDTAIKVITLGTEMAGEDEAAKRTLDKLAKKIVASDSSDDTMKKLQALGYLGSDED